MTLITRRETVGLALGLAATAARAQQSQPIKVAIIGYTGRGDFGHHWDLGWNHIPGAEVVAVSDPDAAGRAAGQRRSGAERGYADYREMIERERPGIVCIALRWADERLVMFRAAAEIGAHIQCEKPFAPCLSDADQMVAVAAARKIKVQVGHQARAAELTHRVRQMIQDGVIGELVEMRARGKEDNRAGGEDMAVLGTHSLDLMRFFAGDPLWVTAHVMQGNRDVRRNDARQGTEHVGNLAGDQINATFLFAGGLHGHFESRATKPYPPGDRCGLTLLGSKGCIFINVGTSRAGEAYLLRSPMWMSNKGDQWERLGPSTPDTVGDFDGPAHFMSVDLLDAIKQDRDPLCNALDGRWAIEMVSGIYHAHFSGTRLAFPLEDRGDAFVA